MIKYITLLSVVSTLASPGAAQGVKVSLVGKHRAAIHADVSRAA